jgi:hypothetical protein
MSWTTPRFWWGALLLTVVTVVSACDGQAVQAAPRTSTSYRRSSVSSTTSVTASTSVVTSTLGEPDTAATMQTPTVAPTTTIPDTAAYCAAIARLLGAHGTGDAAGQYTQAALPYLQAAEEVAPGSFKAPLETVIAWLHNGAPRPVPAAVSQAEQEGETDYINICH